MYTIFNYLHANLNCRILLFLFWLFAYLTWKKCRISSLLHMHVLIFLKGRRMSLIRIFFTENILKILTKRYLDAKKIALLTSIFNPFCVRWNRIQKGHTKMYTLLLLSNKYSVNTISWCFFFGLKVEGS